MLNEELIDEIVEKCAGKISVFLGAGASVPLGLPDMMSFWKNAYGEHFVNSLNSPCPYTIATRDIQQANVNKESAMRRLVQTASIGQQRVSPDLEVIYDYIHNNPILAMVGKGKNHENQVKFLHLYRFTQDHSGHSRSPDFVKYAQNYNNFRDNFHAWLEDICECIEGLRKMVNESYLINDAHDAVDKAKSCFSFLPMLFRNDSPVVFTTNYDTIFEALGESGELGKIGYTLQSGSALRNGRGRRFYFDLQHYLQRVEKPLYLFHLHGSVAWKKGRNGLIEDYFPGNHNGKSAIVEPVISKRQQNKGVFSDLYQIFEKSLYRNSVLLVIGFSFRDDHIKKIVEKRLILKNDFHVLCVAPQNENEPDMDRHLRELEEKYERKFIWLKEYFGVAQTEESILGTIAKINPH